MGSSNRSGARAIMIQGTGSDVGKSLLVAGLCRLAQRRGHRVRPFKPQNMSNNAAVAADGGEIGRAQALQARACGVPPTSAMNPVLLKPQTDTGAQLVLRGRVAEHAEARDYMRGRGRLLPVVLQAFQELRGEADLVFVEGAGSPAEVNLRAGDIANMGFAEAADVPVVLAGDIERGGVIAALVGTHELLAASERQRVVGFLINKFRGDVRLFDDGLRIITEHTGWPSFGVVPYLAAASRLPPEDAVAVEHRARAPLGQAQRGLRVAVPMLSRAANLDDLDPLLAEPGVQVEFVPPGRALPVADLVVLTGTKATRHDLDHLRQQGWHVDIEAHHRRGGQILGLCGGYQLLGRRIVDPGGVEGPAGESRGLGFLDVETVLAQEKTVREATGVDREFGEAVRGYEIHVGDTQGPDAARPLLWLRVEPDCPLPSKSRRLLARDARPLPAGDSGQPSAGDSGALPDGAVSACGRVAGTYLHGLFASDGFRRRWLARLGASPSTVMFEAGVEAALDDIADELALCVRVDALLSAAR